MSRRIAPFIVIGGLGFAVQIGVLVMLTQLLHCPYPIATLLGVESAVLHNFAWHVWWTWRDRTGTSPLWRQLWRFHAGNALASIAGNVVITAALVEGLHSRPESAAVVAVAAMSIVNFLVADRWVFHAGAIAALTVAAVLAGASPVQAEPRRETISAWDQSVAAIDQNVQVRMGDAFVATPVGQSTRVDGGIVHEWRGSTMIRGITVAQLTQALQFPGLPPPSDDLLEARVLGRTPDGVRLYMKVTRRAIVTATYDTEHQVRFASSSASSAMSRSESTRITEVGGDDRGFLWRLNSYWRYRQQGDDVRVDMLSVSLSRDLPALLRPIAGPIVDRIARESVRQSLEAVERFGEGLGQCAAGCGAVARAAR